MPPRNIFLSNTIEVANSYLDSSREVDVSWWHVTVKIIVEHLGFYESLFITFENIIFRQIKYYLTSNYVLYMIHMGLLVWN